MKPVLLVLLTLFSFSATAGDLRGDRIIYQASDLVSACRGVAEGRYIAKNITPYNWTASYHDSANILYVDGKLKVHQTEVEVHCRLARGSRLEYLVIQINDPAL